MNKLKAQNGYVALTPQQLKLRASFAGELWRDGKIERTECFRLEMDAAIGRDTGSVTFEENDEYRELIRDGWSPKRPHSEKSAAAGSERNAHE